MKGNFLARMCALAVIALSSVYFCPETQPVQASTSVGNVVWGTRFDWLSTRYATYSDIANLNCGQIRVLKNSVYARHGYIFKDSNLRSYFNGFSWYHGWRKKVTDLNKYETKNVSFLKKYEC